MGPVRTTLPTNRLFSDMSSTQHYSHTSSIYGSSQTTAHTGACSINCACRTVSAINTTTSRHNSVQLSPDLRGTGFNLASESSKCEMNYDLDKLEAGLQDFDFNDVFDHQNSHDKRKDSPKFGDKSPKKSKSKDHADSTAFSYSHYSAHTKWPAAGKLPRTQSEIMKPKHARNKSENFKKG